MEVTYAISEQFVETFFSSCQDVRVFGAYLLDYEYGCGKLKRANCTAVEFMRVLGSLSEIPFNFRPLIIDNIGKVLHPTTSDEESIIGKEWPRASMNDTAYRCDQAPPNMSPCQCDHCPSMCPAAPSSKLILGKNAQPPSTSSSKDSHHISPNSSSSLFGSSISFIIGGIFLIAQYM